MYLDFHTHSVTNHDNTQSIYNVVLSEESISSRANWCEKEAISLGIHPWYIEECNLDLLYEFLRESGKAINVKCIGEAGLDKLKETDLKLQESVFLAQIRIAEVLKKPVVIHCVRAFNEIISIQRIIDPGVPLVIHGFSRKAELAKELVSKGFYLSFGADLINKVHVQEAFAEMPLDKFFLETDDKEDITIQQIYQKAAELKGIDLEKLKETVWRNYRQIIKH
jgi:TatD DNase family protein